MNLQVGTVNHFDVLDAQKEHWHGRMVRNVDSIQKTADELLDYAKNPSVGDADRFPIRILATALELKEKLDRLMPAIECYTKNMLTIERERRKFKDLRNKE